MRHLKNLFVAAFTFLSFSSAMASSDPVTSASNEIQVMLQSSLSGMDFQEEAKVYITFMLNERNEVIVISTNSGKLDYTIKDALNYKAIDATNLERGKKYTLPVSITN